MKPRTRIQKRVAELLATLPSLTAEQELWAKDMLFGKWVYTNLENYTCFECGHRWPRLKSEPRLETALLGQTCPACGESLTTSLMMKKRVFSKQRYFTIIDRYGEFQVIRTFVIHKMYRCQKPARYVLSEIYQHWIRSDGKHIPVAKIRLMGYYLNWSYSSPLEIRPDHDSYYQRSAIYPKMRIIKELRRNGFKKGFHNLHPAYFFECLLSDSRFETLFKTKQYGIISQYDRYNNAVQKFWPSIRICIRNNYKIQDFSMWVDYLRLLNGFGKDLHNPKYICPVNLKYEHDKYVAKRRAIQRREAAKAQKERLAKENPIYQARFKPFLGLELSDGNIDLVMLNNLEEFIKEGDLMNHCIYTNSYYEKNNLIFSARKNKKRVCTVQYDLDKMEVLQARGIGNKTTRYTNQIITLLENNKQKITNLKNKINE